MGATPQDALSVKARRHYRLLWLNSLDVLSKGLVVRSAINGASHGLPNDDQVRLNPSPVCAQHETVKARHLIHPGMRHR